MTEFEKAQIRLKVWEALRGWGITKKDENGIPISEPWDWNDRLKFADQLIEWVMK